MSLEQVLQKWAASSEGQKKLKAEAKSALSRGKSFGKTSGTGVNYSVQTAKQYAEEMMDEIIRYLPRSLANSPEPITRDSFQEPVINVRDDGFDVRISFRPDAVHRESLAPEKYPDGVENIVVHLSNGWSARGAVYGEWHGVETWSRMESAGDDFMREAVMSFNATHPLAEARLGDEYK